MSCLSITLLTGCAPVIVGGMATAGYMAVQDRGIKTAFLDTKIKTNIKERLVSSRYQYATEVNVSVIEGRVLLTGVVPNTQLAVQAEQITRGADGVKEVYNELFLDGIYSSEQYSKDTWMGTQIRGKLLGAKDINAANYQISVINNNVYIVGLTDTPSERERVLHIARTTKGVDKVHNYVKLVEGQTKTFLGLEVDSQNTSDNEFFLDN